MFGNKKEKKQCFLGFSFNIETPLTIKGASCRWGIPKYYIWAQR